MNNQLRKTAGFGAKLNTYEQPRRQADYPAWANPGQREDWRSCGLVFWKDDARQITLFAAQDALDVLTDMRSNSDWKQFGRIVGRPVLCHYLYDSQRKPELVLSDEISLSSAEAELLFDLLQANERVLGEMAKADEAMGRTRMAAAVRLGQRQVAGAQIVKLWEGQGWLLLLGC